MDITNEKIIASENEKKESVKNHENYSTFSLHNVEEMATMLIGLSLANFTPAVEQELYSCVEKTATNDLKNLPMQSPLSVSRTMMCSVCNANFTNRSDQILHYKLDWHRFNLKLKLQGEKPVSEEKFVEVSGNISSLSGSDSENDEKSDDDTSSSDVYSSPHHKRPTALPRVNSPIRRERSSSVTSTDTETEDSEYMDKNPCSQSRMQPKLYFRNKFHKIIALYRCVVHGKQNIPKSQPDLLSMVTSIPNSMYWAIILVGGGHFAAALYNQSEMIQHKTFHRYTVRAKQGSNQSSRDGKHGGNQPKSAGATLRRHNEVALIKDIQDLLQSWNTDLQKCSCIFYRAPSFNRVALFRGKNPPFKKNDPRLRNIPFPTRRATFNEVQRVYRLLSTLECFGEIPDEFKQIPKSPKVYLGSKNAKKRISDKSIDQENQNGCEQNENLRSVRQKPKKSTMIKKQGYKFKVEGITPLEDKSEIVDTMSDSDNCVEFQFIEETVSTSDLKETSVFKRRKHKTRSNSLTKRQQDPAMDDICEEKYHMKNALYTACQTGNLEELEKLLSSFKNKSLIADVKQIVDQDTDSQFFPDKDSIHLGNFNETNIKMLETISSCTSKVLSNEEIILKVNQETTALKLDNSSTNNSNQMELCSNSVQKEISQQQNNVNIDPSNSKTNRCKKNDNTKWDIDMPISVIDILNIVISDGGSTLLHVATKEGHKEIVKMLMEHGANPTVRDKRGLTPYMLSNDREMRDIYRRFMADNPDKFDYKSAQIPSPLTEEMIAERLEKKKEKQKLKREKYKEKKAAEREKRLDEEERKRFLSLSDREKRAVAAERRYLGHLSETGRSGVVLSRCFQCGIDISGKTPFEYDDNRFCSTDCVKTHRKSRKVS